VWEILENGQNKGGRLERYRERQEIKEPTSLWHWLMRVLFSLSLFAHHFFCRILCKVYTTTTAPQRNISITSFLCVSWYGGWKKKAKTNVYLH